MVKNLNGNGQAVDDTLRRIADVMASRQIG